MVPKQKSGEAPVDGLKKRRVGFARTDVGIEANDCIKIFLVSSQDEVGAKDGFCIQPIDLNQFFGEDGKIYGYKDLKISIWLSTVSFHACADITYESTFNGGKGVTDLKPALQDIFGEALLERSEFLETFSVERQCVRNVISTGTVLHCYSWKKDAVPSDTRSDADGSAIEHQIVRMELHTPPVGLLYGRLESLAFLLIDGSSPIDVSDPGWEIYFVVKKIRCHSEDYEFRLLGFATLYRFYNHPDSTRLRLSQILVLPPYQGYGHGRRLLESVNSVAVAQNVYDLAMEEPSDRLQYLRSCIDTLRLLDFEPIKSVINSVASSLKTGSMLKKACRSQTSPPSHAIEIVRQKFKINKKQFMKCWDILIYLSLDPQCSSMENFRACIAARINSDILDKDSESKGKTLIEVPNDYDHDMTFVVYCSPRQEESDSLEGKLDGGQDAQEEQLNKLVEKQMADISNIAKRVSLLKC